MLARLQRWLTIGVSLSAVCCLGVFLWMGMAAWGIAAAALILGSYTIVLAVEFLLMSSVNDPDGASIPKASAAELFLAWWNEVRAGHRIFCWRQPFRSNAEPDHLPAGARGKRGIVLVHGLVCNRGFWNPWLKRLRANDTPFVAVNLEPVFGSIDHYTNILETAVLEVTDATERAPVIVAHSMGGLVARRWLDGPGTDQRAHWVVTIGTPHRGTWLARFARSANGREMAIGSDWLARLGKRNRRMDETAPSRFTCFYGNCDNVVFPPSAATLPGADNRLLRRTAHLELAFRPEVFDEVMRCLRHGPDPADQKTVSVESRSVAKTSPSDATRS